MKVIMSKTGTVRITKHWGAFVQPLLQCKIKSYYILWACVCILRYAACNAHTLHCHLWFPPLYNIFSTLSHKGYDFRKKNKLLNSKCVFGVSVHLFLKNFFILRRVERDMIKSVYWSSCKVPVILVRYWWNFNFLDRFSLSTQISNFMKIRSVRTELFHTKRQTDKHEEANSRFAHFCDRA